MSNEIIVAEKKNGSGCFNKAFVCNDESDFISRIRETQCQHRSDKEMVETLDAAIEYNDETFGVSTLIVSRAEFDAGPVRLIQTKSKAPEDSSGRFFVSVSNIGVSRVKCTAISNG